MALTSSSISLGREKTRNILIELNKARVAAGNLKNFLAQNTNFNKFVQGTSIGQNQNNKLITILGLLNQDLMNQTTNLTTRLNTFFDYQEELNRKTNV